MMVDDTEQLGPFDDLDIEGSPSQSGPAPQPVQATNVTFANEDTLAELISKARVERQDASVPTSKGDESHLRSFFLHAEHVKNDVLGLPEHQLLFAAVPDVDLQNVEEMQQALYALFRTEEQQFCQQLVHYVSSIRKRNKGHVGERFPLKTLDHKIRRLSTYLISEHSREVREGLAAPRDINLLDSKNPIWSQLVDRFRQQGRERGEEYEVTSTAPAPKAVMEPACSSRSDGSAGGRNRRKGDESHLRSFFLYAACVRNSREAPAVQKQLFSDVPDVCATDIAAMRRELYNLFSRDERRFCKQMIFFITSIRKRNKGCEGQAFPPDTLHHKLRRLSGYLTREHQRQLRERGGELRDINMLDKASDIWGELHDVLAGLSKQHAEEAAAASSAAAVAAAAALSTASSPRSLQGGGAGQQLAAAGGGAAAGGASGAAGCLPPGGRPSKRAKTTPGAVGGGGISNGGATTTTASTQDLLGLTPQQLDSVDSLLSSRLMMGLGANTQQLTTAAASRRRLLKSSSAGAAPAGAMPASNRPQALQQDLGGGAAQRAAGAAQACELQGLQGLQMPLAAHLVQQARRYSRSPSPQVAAGQPRQAGQHQSALTDGFGQACAFAASASAGQPQLQQHTAGSGMDGLAACSPGRRPPELETEYIARAAQVHNELQAKFDVLLAEAEQLPCIPQRLVLREWNAKISKAYANTATTRIQPPSQQPQQQQQQQPPPPPQQQQQQARAAAAAAADAGLAQMQRAAALMAEPPPLPPSVTNNPAWSTVLQLAKTVTLLSNGGAQDPQTVLEQHAIISNALNAVRQSISALPPGAMCSDSSAMAAAGASEGCSSGSAGTGAGFGGDFGSSMSEGVVECGKGPAGARMMGARRARAAPCPSGGAPALGGVAPASLHGGLPFRGPAARMPGARGPLMAMAAEDLGPAPEPPLLAQEQQQQQLLPPDMVTFTAGSSAPCGKSRAPRSRLSASSSQEPRGSGAGTAGRGSGRGRGRGRGRGSKSVSSSSSSMAKQLQGAAGHMGAWPQGPLQPGCRQWQQEAADQDESSLARMMPPPSPAAAAARQLSSAGSRGVRLGMAPPPAGPGLPPLVQQHAARQRQRAQQQAQHQQHEPALCEPGLVNSASAGLPAWDAIMQELLAHEPVGADGMLGSSSNVSALSGGAGLLQQHL